ncbi:MAG TPA: FAD-dependent oxidoreductase [Kofleriaceae bacterium]|nr:FAD-dependent oxidoreductase [Kofleriaceae bacterium]
MADRGRWSASAHGKRVVILGSGFAGFTAAAELAGLLGDRHEVVVIARDDQFLFVPSLPWVPFGLRTREHITFAVGPALESRGVRFRHTNVRRLDLDRRLVMTGEGVERYDYLLIATGSRPNHAAVPGLGPNGYTQSIVTLPEAERTGAAFARLLERPGPVVIGSVQGASCLTAADEFLFAMACELHARGLSGWAPLTFITAQPSLGHGGPSGLGSSPDIAEQFMARLGIRSIVGAVVQAISPSHVELVGGEKLPFAFAMLVPPSMGVDVVRACTDITDAFGFVRINEFCQTEAHPEVFAAGVAAASCTSAPEEMAHIVAHNIAAAIQGGSAIGWPSRYPAVTEHAAPPVATPP